MNDTDARRLLAGVDAPRPLPERLRADLVAALAEGDLGLAVGEAPRPLPDDLRRRLEAVLVRPSGRPAPAPSSLPRRVLAVAAAVVVLLGVVTAVARDPDDGPTQLAGRDDATEPSTTAAGTGRGTADSSTAGEVGGGPAAGSGTAGAVPFADGGSAPPPPPDAAAGSTGGGSSGGAAAPTAGGPGGDVQAASIHVAVTGSGTAVAEGFEAYLRTLNGSGGIGGRQVVGTDRPEVATVATVNLGTAPFAGSVDGVVFETAFVDDRRLRGTVASLASPLEAQARLAVAHAFPERADGRRAAVYVSGSEPWGDVAAVLEEALRQRGVTPVRVPFNAGAPTFLPADAAFLSLTPHDVRAWVGAAPAALPGGAWGLGSAWDDALAERAAQLSLRVLSPYAPVGGDEQAALAGALPEGVALSAAAVHGWVTAKALAVLLAANDGTTLTEADLDRLVGFAPGWAPPFEVRPGTRARTPAAVVLRPTGDRFTAEGGFERS